MKPPSKCPICGNSTTWIHVNTYHEGFSFWKSLIGNMILGRFLGTQAGFLGNKKVVYMCTRCHYSAVYRR